jgi:hypothetical protein
MSYMDTVLDIHCVRLIIKFYIIVIHCHLVIVISQQSVFYLMSSSSAMASSSWRLSMRVDLSIGVRSTNASTWGRRRREGDQASSSGTSRECCHILATQMGCMWCKAGRRRDSISLAMMSLVSPIGSGRV